MTYRICYENVDSYTIGQRIQEVRLKKGIKQHELAKKIGVDRTSLSAYENGKRLPDIMTLCRIANVLEVTLDELII